MKLGSKGYCALQCLFDIQQECTFDKTGKNTKGGNYGYYKLGDLQGPAKPFLFKHKCVVLFNTNNTSCTGGFTKVQGSNDVSPKDKLVTYSYTEVTARIQSILDVEDYVEATCFGYKVDQTSDKALGAYTVGARYALMELFAVEGDIDPDSDQDDVRGGDLMANILKPQGANKPAAPAAPQSTINDLLSQLGA